MKLRKIKFNPLALAMNQKELRDIFTSANFTVRQGIPPLQEGKKTPKKSPSSFPNPINDGENRGQSVHLLMS